MTGNNIVEGEKGFISHDTAMVITSNLIGPAFGNPKKIIQHTEVGSEVETYEIDMNQASALARVMSNSILTEMFSGSDKSKPQRRLIGTRQAKETFSLIQTTQQLLRDKGMPYYQPEGSTKILYDEDELYLWLTSCPGTAKKPKE